MFKYGVRSKKRLLTCHTSLQLLMNEAIKVMDITILEGYRGKVRQNNYFHARKSKLLYPQSKHNKKPAEAVDIMPWFSKKPHIRWNDTKSIFYMAGIIRGISHKLGIKIIWGGCWRNDNNFDRNSFFDGPHFQLDL